MKKRITPKIFFQAMVLLVLVACTPVVRKEKTNAVLPIIPQPKEVRLYDGSFVLDSMTHAVFS